MTKRLQGEGSIRKRPDGRYEIRLRLGRDPITGKPRRKSVYGTTPAETVQNKKELHAREHAGEKLRSSSQTTARFLKGWHTLFSASEWSQNTIRLYREALDNHLIPAFGLIRLERLDTDTIQTWITRSIERDGASTYGLVTAHSTLRSALDHARRTKLIPTNPAKDVVLPKPKTKPKVILDAPRARALLKSADAHPLGTLVILTIATGIRIGEVTGIRWTDLEPLEAGRLTVEQQLQYIKEPHQPGRLLALPLKSKKSRRTLQLAPGLVERLRQHRIRQREDRLKAGGRAIDTGLVFTTPRPVRNRPAGSPLYGMTVRRIFKQILAAAKLPRMRFHDLRHSVASILIAEGFQLPEISKLLGHAKLSTTADLYGHLLETTTNKAALAMGQLLND